ncbi:8678_t:CDS:2, partial [Racocetra fulgida]
KKRKAEESIEEEGSQEGIQSLTLFQTLHISGTNPKTVFSRTALEAYHSIGVRPLPDKNLQTCDPEEVSYVFVGSKIAGSTDCISLKTFDGKYLASDKFGAITAEREAIGPQEEWRPIIRSDGIALQNYYDKFLSVDEIADGGYKLRADVETIGFCETLHVKCQSRFRKKSKSTRKESGRIKTTKEDISELKKAKKEGSFSEA